MPITEFALLRLKEQEPSAKTKSSLRDVVKQQSAWSKHPVNFLRQIEDSGLVYLLGGWASVAEHFGDWITSAPNQRLLAELKDAIDIEWLFHLDIDPSARNIPLDAPVLGITRYFVEASRKDEFESIFQAGAPHLGEYTAPYSYAGGWRIDKDGEDEEFVLFSGWNKVEDHFGFAESDAFKEFGKIKSAIKGAEIKHAHLEKWG
ncbi:uncharacterized protein N7496_003032 [Penicillium cataractarum]|uniref:ABM domain-containing protein n=1 Tax=Penicillium cataractarum TaxID=2100454 RepID=A0A9W9VH42_9EURO|nr:uncharacterized protein N7496_003032 [Penicillium cataractarum]KAJ5380604.1 hypothetical protein N7496_003032 [Penicillium cataractarum]